MATMMIPNMHQHAGKTMLLDRLCCCTDMQLVRAAAKTVKQHGFFYNVLPCGTNETSHQE